MISLKNCSISKFTLWVKVATFKIAHFLDSPASLFLLEDNAKFYKVWSASTRLAGKPKKSTLVRPTAVLRLKTGRWRNAGQRLEARYTYDCRGKRIRHIRQSFDDH
jgi:hypothetical protein